MSQEITKVTVTDFMGIGGTIELVPAGALQLIAGPNGSGKSSLIHAMEEVFDPKGVRFIPKPIHDGATEARVEIETTVAKLVRVWKKDGPGELSAYALDGAKYPSGKEFVVDATGGALFDPDDFVKLDEKKQRDQLLARVDLPFDLDEIDAKRKGFFDARTDVTRDMKALTAQLAGSANADATVPDAEVSAAAILAEHERARAHNASVDQLVQAAAGAEDERVRAEATVARLTDELDAARTYLVRAQDSEVEVYAKVKAAVLVDTDEITERLSSVEATNAKVRAQAARRTIAAKLAGVQAFEAELTAKIDAIDAQKTAGLKAAKFPVDGLGIDDVGIVYNGIPFKQVNSAVQDTIAFDLATSGTPDLRVVVMKSGDRLDSARLDGIRKIAEARNYLVFMERDRDESRQIGFTIPESAS
jgi:energy-coupling factor transporter ATP-binding protein EcfA2